eukprot:TRINITY_DN11806_c0_g1_i1.p1 TRINITY_DN11806_c0_g1~~TRINITY_DN11806_c0_g1_i1.p1  ORF type:complete len:318 (-),score=64.94 TRINITY_DN11806_c0_g1_i1:21-974(-)
MIGRVRSSLLNRYPHRDDKDTLINKRLEEFRQIKEREKVTEHKQPIKIHDELTTSKHRKIKMPKISHIITVASGKGGVGKSSCAVNIAIALSKLNHRVGLLDADVYGPSIPTMMNLVGHTPQIDPFKLMTPLRNYGIDCNSTGFLIEDDKAVIWRGPLVMGAVKQLMTETNWGTLDFLVVDLPPGTGDVHLTLAQDFVIDGAVIVSTPQDVAMADVVRGIAMFQRVDVPILGLIENMSYYQCDGCGEKKYIFGKDGVKKKAEELQLDMIGEIPLASQVREGGDAGVPVLVSSPKSPESLAFMDIADKIVSKLKNKQF